MSMLKYDGLYIGNHDFDTEIDGLILPTITGIASF